MLSHPGRWVCVPAIAAVVQLAERSLDVVPTALVLETPTNELGDEGAAAPSTATPVELGNPSARRVLTLDRSWWQKVIHDTFPFGETHVYRKEEGRWVETVADVPGVVDASWYLLAGEERFDASYEVRSYNTEEATVTEVFDPASGRAVGLIPSSYWAVWRFAETGLAVGNDPSLADGTVGIHDYPSGREVRRLAELRDLNAAEPFGGYAFLDGNQTLGRLDAVGVDGAVGSWDTDTWEFSVVFETSDIVAIRHHPNGEIAASAQRDGSLLVRDAESLEPIGTPLLGHTAEVGVADKAIYFFGDRYLVTLGQDKTLRLWDLESRQQIGDPLLSAGAAAFDAQPATGMVATASDSRFLLWNYRVDERFDIACRAARRNLTREEWERFGPQGEPYHATCTQWPALGS